MMSFLAGPDGTTKKRGIDADDCVEDVTKNLLLTYSYGTTLEMMLKEVICNIEIEVVRCQTSIQCNMNITKKSTHNVNLTYVSTFNLRLQQMYLNKDAVVP